MRCRKASPWSYMPSRAPLEGKVLGAIGQGTVEDAGVVADVGALEQGLVLGTQGGVETLPQHFFPTPAARLPLLGPHHGMALGALGAHAHVAAAHTLLIGDGVAVLTGRGWGKGRGRVTQCSLPQEPCCQGKPAQEEPDTDPSVPRELG